MQVAFHSLRALHAGQGERFARIMADVFEGGWFVLGETVAAFERAFADYCGVAGCIGVGNGTDALELALRAVGVGPDDEVVTVANAGFYASTAILACAARPLYVDVDAATLQCDPLALDAALARAPRAVVVTHLYGRLAAVETIVAQCREHGVAVIEDCAQAHGARRAGRVAGSFGDLGCYSFYPTKNLGALGDGGAVVGSDARLLDAVRALRQYGWGEKYRVARGGGRNSRLDAMQAAWLHSELGLLDARNARRREIAARYRAALDSPRMQPLPAVGEDDVAHLFVLRSRHRDALRAHLAQAGVGSEVHYPVPDHRQPLFGARFADLGLPVTERACAEALSLPCHPALSDAEVDHVIAACQRFRG